MKRLVLGIGGALLALGTVAATRMGGWAVVTVEDLPDYIVAGKPVDLTFVVRQHGVHPMPDLKPSIEARAGWNKVSGRAWAAQRAGTYRGTITVPDVGDWQITIHSGHGKSKGTLLPIRAVAAGSAVPARVADSERGRVLFAAKGCVTCHVRDGFGDGAVKHISTDLTGRRFPADYLAQFLADPSIIPAASRDPYVRMSNLELKQGEIASLVAFINSERALSSR